ncbi:AT-rich interactive domain-containing protein 2 [Smittium mucronatum]|uniref:AT-rich interactive domain-containing protein 2 n=1 Tax=Smittium mucronatum TaxID=133383 RepID=A0A1R0GT92_9FUNG|nr:AT-rich interactive domain-containing protein 2 [Smittium mucronatum]
MDIFKRVVELGGYKAVNDTKSWKIVVDDYDFPPTCTNAAYSIKTMYLKYLSEFENVYIWKMDLNVDRFNNVRQNISTRNTINRDGTPTNRSSIKRRSNRSDSTTRLNKKISGSPFEENKLQKSELLNESPLLNISVLETKNDNINEHRKLLPQSDTPNKAVFNSFQTEKNVPGINEKLLTFKIFCKLTP